MLLSLNWLNDFIDHGLSVEELADKLTMSGTEVKAIKHVGEEFDHIVVGEVTKIEPHPHADKLHLPTVRVSKRKTMQVVCGAPNLKVGQKVAFAHPGASVFGDAEQKKRVELTTATIRGIKSEGMICSERELGLGKRHYEGILDLEEEIGVTARDLEPGIDLADALDLRDIVFELEVTPNRGDCLSVLGIARELAALTGKPIRLPFGELGETRASKISVEDFEKKIRAWKLKESKKKSGVKILVKDDKLCPRYSALVLSNLETKRSPLWVRRRLINCGVRAISTLVDATNYVMLELGEPEHAFDRRDIAGDTIIVRRAHKDEKAKTLDGQLRQLDPDMLMIADKERVVGIAGIMGGENSEVREDTTEIILEAAHFESVNNRHSSSKLGLRTEACTRFEKFVDPNLTLWSLYRTQHLLCQMGVKAVSDGLIDVDAANLKKKKISLGLGKIEQLLGTTVSKAQASKILKGLGFQISEAGASVRPDSAKASSDKQKSASSKKGWRIQVTVPTYRPDILEEADLVEEVARIIGYDKMGERIPRATFPLKTTTHAENIANRLRNLMKSLGFTESYSYSMLSKKNLQRLGFNQRKFIPIANPLAEFEYMRASLLPGLLLAVEKNKDMCKEMKLFDIGSVFVKRENFGKDLPEEPVKLAGIILEEEKTDGKIWKQGEEAIESGKQLARELLSSLGITQTAFSSHLPSGQKSESPEKKWIHPGRQTDIVLGKHAIGWLGELHPAHLAKLELAQRRAVYFQFDVQALKQSKQLPHFSSFSVYPAVSLDVSFFVDDKTTAERVVEVIKSTGGALVRELELLDVYTKGDFGAGKKSMTWRINYQSDERTLEEKNVQKIHAEVESALESALGAKVRK